MPSSSFLHSVSRKIFRHGHLAAPRPASSPSVAPHALRQTSPLSYFTQVMWSPPNSSASLLLIFGYKKIIIIISLDGTQSRAPGPLCMPFPLPEMSSPVLPTSIQLSKELLWILQNQMSLLKASILGSCALSSADVVWPLDFVMFLSLSSYHDALGCVCYVLFLHHIVHEFLGDNI